jgi:hypothetical protein
MALVSTQPLVKMSTKNIPGGKGGRCVMLTSPLSRAKCHEIWDPKPPGPLWATPSLLWDCFNFYSFYSPVSTSVSKTVLSLHVSSPQHYATPISPQYYVTPTSPYPICPPVWSSFTSLLLSFNTRRTAETASSHISSSQISCKASSPTLKGTQHPIQWAPEAPSRMVKWLQPNADNTLWRLGMNGAWNPLQQTH